MAAIDAIREQLLTGVLPDARERRTVHRVPAPASLPARGDHFDTQGSEVPVQRSVRMRYLSTLYVRDHRARVQHRRGSLTVSSPEGSQRVPLEGLDAVVVLGGAQVTMQALDACVRRGVRVAALHRSGAVRFLVSGATNGNVHLRKALFEAVMDDSRSLDLSRAIVAAKLQNSRRVVGRWSRDEKDAVGSKRLADRSEQIRQRIARLVDAVTGDHLRGIEGDAARIYFRAVEQVVATAELGFSSRTRRPPRDPINAMLSFCYGLLVTECTGALESVGLDFQMGLFHRPRAGRPLPCAGPCGRAARVDGPVCGFVGTPPADWTSELRLHAWRRRLLERRRKNRPDQGVGRPQRGRSSASNPRTAGWPMAIPSVQATLLARHLRGDLPAYPPFVLP